MEGHDKPNLVDGSVPQEGQNVEEVVLDEAAADRPKGEKVKVGNENDVNVI